MKDKLPTGPGLTGNSGVLGKVNVSGIYHIAAPYSNNGMVFINTHDENGHNMSWERVTREEAKRREEEPIQCSMCMKPAVMLDHYYPYYPDMNRCEDHIHSDETKVPMKWENESEHYEAYIKSL
jgi:hypothetical protein